MGNLPTKTGENGPAATGLSSVFPSGDTVEGLHRIRKRLLDLTNRNPLLNYHHPQRSCIRVVNVSMDQVLRSLLEDHKLPLEPVPRTRKKGAAAASEGNLPQVPFEPVPGSRDANAPEEAERGRPGQRGVVEDAKRAGWNTSFDLSGVSGDGKPLCVLQYRDELERSIRLMDSKARTIIEESGSNMLYLVFGFLEWYESEDSDESHLAPLLMVPVQLERTRGARLGTLEYTGDQFECNPSLAERLYHDFSLELPAHAEEQGLEVYFGKFERILKAKPAWKLRRFLTLSFLSFTKILMYRDLDPARWPDASLPQHPRVRELFEGTKQTEPGYGQEYMIDAPEMKSRVPKLILDADSSQHSALIDAVEGKNLVVEGPPGTGKSQTITNLIAHAISAGKTVLFVAEKLAALEVVRKRLDDAELGIFCLELHSHRTQKQGLIRDLEERLKARGRFSQPPKIEAKIKLLSEKKERLIQYARLMNSTWTPLGKTIFEVLWARHRALRELPVPQLLRSPIQLPLAANCSREDLERAEQLLAIYLKHLKGITAGGRAVNDHPWAWVTNASLGFQDEARLSELIRSIPASVEAARQAVGSLSATWGIEIGLSLGSLSEVERILKSLTSVEGQGHPALLAPCRSPEARKAISSVIERIEEEAEVKAKGLELSQRVDTEVITDAAELQAYANTIWSAGLWERLFGRHYRAAKRAYRRISPEKRQWAQMAADLRELAEYHLRMSRLSQAASVDSLLGSLVPEIANGARAGLTEVLSCFRTLVEATTGGGLSQVSLPLIHSELRKHVSLIKSTLRIAETVQSLKLPSAASDRLLCQAFKERMEDLKEGLRRLADCSLIGECAEVARISDAATDQTWTHGSFDAIVGRCTNLDEHLEDLRRWILYLKLRRESKTQGIGDITELAHTGKIPGEDLLPCFRFIFYDSLSRAAFEQHSALEEFSGVTLEEVRNQFSSLDRELMQLQRRHFAALIDSRPVPEGNKSGPVGTWSDLALIHHEIGKQKRHVPIRKLVERSGYALQCLKPCFMMGPLSVAQYLAAGKLTFDLIVMDEASQLRPEDAIGAIARGGQLVVVGDPKQLPPTDFFQRLDLDDAEDIPDDDRAVVEEGESILDVAMSVYQPARRLRWHYRSRHESLIAFSNNQFYQGDLIVFPTPFPKREDIGVRYHEIPHPVYENRRNVPEAQAVVDAAIAHMCRRAEESLGVVTLNLQQRELIEDLLETRLSEDPLAQAYQEKYGGGLESFFVKNLENVQGDERDVIFISCTYGPDRQGNQYQRFGPINSQNGYRRLNVLFTRAKKRVEVFSSLDPAKILIEPGTQRGVRALKDYLQYAKTGVIGGVNLGAREPGSDFEVSVAGVLADNGYKVQPQVGVAGFFIDLAVIHPDESGAFLSGIECDGAAYHSARSVRDRDRLRQEILQNLGWKIYRIWSTDWFRSRDRETKQLLNYLESLVAQDPKARARRAERNKEIELRERLIQFRENTIRTAFPDSEPARCLLRDQMIDELVRYRPTSKDQWFRQIPLRLRSGTDSAQVASFLDDVLRIIRDDL